MSTEPRNEMKSQEITAVLVVIAVGLCLLPVFFGDICSQQLSLFDRFRGKECSDWYNIVRDYQTLISGFFAIAAAYIAVFHMKETENAQRLRHYQQVIAQYTPHMLTYNRAIYVMKPRLEALLNAIDLLPLDQEAPVAAWTEQSRMHFLQAMSESRKLQEALSGAIILETAPAIGPHNEDLISQCRQYLTGILLDTPDDFIDFIRHAQRFDPETGIPVAFSDLRSLSMSLLATPARDLFNNLKAAEYVFAMMHETGQKLARSAPGSIS